MSSDIIDVAILCSGKATSFIEEDERFEIAGTVLKNTHVILERNDNVKNVGVSQGRKYEIEMAEDTYGHSINIVPMSTRTLPYAMESGEVDAIVIDYMKASTLNWNMVFPSKNKDYDTFSLVVKKDFKKSKEYKEFRHSYNKVVGYFNENNNFFNEVNNRSNIEKVDERRKQQWLNINMKIQILK